MDSKEAIRTLKEFDITEGEANEIIELLQRGKKYKAMWEEIVRYFNYMEWKDEIIGDLSHLQTMIKSFLNLYRYEE